MAQARKPRTGRGRLARSCHRQEHMLGFLRALLLGLAAALAGGHSERARWERAHGNADRVVIRWL